MSKQPPPAPTASATGPCPTIIQISRTPQHWKFTKHLRTTRPPPFAIVAWDYKPIYDIFRFLVVEQSWCENLLNGILVELQVFCAENYTKVLTGFQKLVNNSRFRQKLVLKPVLHMYHGVRSSLVEKSYSDQNWSYTLYALS